MSVLEDKVVGPLKQAVELMVLDAKSDGEAMNAVDEISQLTTWLEMWSRRAIVRWTSLSREAK